MLRTLSSRLLGTVQRTNAGKGDHHLSRLNPPPYYEEHGTRRHAATGPRANTTF